MRCLAAFVALALYGAPVRAEPPTPVGLWTTLDDGTGQPRSVVRIWEEGGKLRGAIERFMPRPGEDPAPRCTKCKGELKDAPVLGMVVLWGLAQDGRSWVGGEILDPEDGKTYRCTLTLAEGGAKLEVRGFVGVSLFGRTQVWTRAVSAAGG